MAKNNLVRGWAGGPSTPLYLYWHSAFVFPSKKSPSKNLRLEPHPPRARSARRAPESVVFFGRCQRKPLRNRFGLSFGDSIQPRSNLFYQPLIFARSARVVALYSASRFECVVFLSGARARAPSNPRPAAHSTILFQSRGGMQFAEWAAGRSCYSEFYGFQRGSANASNSSSGNRGQGYF